MQFLSNVNGKKKIRLVIFDVNQTIFNLNEIKLSFKNLKANTDYQRQFQNIMETKYKNSYAN